MSTASGTVTIPGYIAGTWDIDNVHSDISFSVRHMMVSKVKGRFGKFEGQIVTADEPLQSSATVTIQLASIDSNDAGRDEHVRSADFLDVEQYPTMTWKSTGVSPSGDGFVADGELTLHGVTRPVALDVEANGFGPDAWGGTRVGFSATTEINRKDFGIEFSMPLDGGGVVLGDKIHISLEIESVLRKPAA